MAWDTRTVLGNITDRELLVATFQVARSVTVSNRLLEGLDLRIDPVRKRFVGAGPVPAAATAYG